MEPNKIEQEFKQQLEQRSIAPSPMAWDRLDAMLTVAEQKAAPKKKANRGWLYMAACFLVLLSGGIFFMNGENGTNNINTTNTPQVVTTTLQPDAVKADNVNTTIAAPTPYKVVTVTGKSHVVSCFNTKDIIPTPPAFDENPTKQQVAQNITQPETPADVKLSRIKVDANALLASVDKPSENNVLQNNVASNNSAVSRPDAKQPGVKVDANSLLTSVEGELDQSFRGKVINSLQKNYNTVKTAVATRNLQ